MLGDTKFWIAPACAMAWFSATAFAVPETAADAVSIQLNTSLAITDGQLIVVDNPWGNVGIRAVPMAAGLEARASVQFTGPGDRPEVLFEPRLEGDATILALAFDPLPETRSAATVRADLVVSLPDRVALEVHMDRGTFTMHPAGFALRLRGNDLRARIRTSGLLDVAVDAGQIIYLPPAERPPLGGRIRTSSAPVDILLADAEGLNFEIISGAAPTTDSLALLQARSISGRRVLFTPRPEQPVLAIQTDTGPVRLVTEGLR